MATMLLVLSSLVISAHYDNCGLKNLCKMEALVWCPDPYDIRVWRRTVSNPARQCNERYAHYIPSWGVWCSVIGQFWGGVCDVALRHSHCTWAMSQYNVNGVTLISLYLGHGSRMKHAVRYSYIKLSVHARYTIYSREDQYFRGDEGL